MAGIRKRLGSLLGPQGKPGPPGEEGEQGIPGVNAVPADEAIASYINTPTSQTRTKLDTSYVQATSIRRILASDNRDTPLEDGDLLLVYEPIQYPFTDFRDGLNGLTERWRQNHWQSEPDTSSLSGTIVSTSQNVGARRLLSFDAADLHDFTGPDVEAVTRARVFFFGPAGFGGGIALRASGSMGTENTYLLVASSESVHLAKIVNGAWIELASTPAPELTNNEWYWLRFKAIGNRLSGKVWFDDQPEPDEWQLNITDNSITGTGWAGIFAGSHSEKNSWDRLGVSFGGADASSEV